MYIPENTIELNLTLTKEQLWNQTHKLNRWSVEKAKKFKIKVRQGREEDRKSCYQLYVDLCRHNKLTPTSIEKLFSIGTLHIAKKGELILAFSIIRTEDKKAILRYNASNYKHRNTQANSLLYWQLFLTYKKKGFTCFDLGGVDLNAKYLKGLSRFKQRWGGELKRTKKKIPFLQYIWWNWLRNIRILRNIKYKLAKKNKPNQ